MGLLLGRALVDLHSARLNSVQWPLIRLAGLIVLAVLTLAGCSGQAASHRVATEDIHLSVVAVRHNSYLLVQVKLAEISDLDKSIQLRNGDRLEVTLNGNAHDLQEQWNGVYSAQIPYSEGALKINLKRTGKRNDALNTQLNLPVSPEFYSPARNALYQSQRHRFIPLSWTGIATENGHYELRCTSRKTGVSQHTGTFVAVDRQRINIPLSELLSDLIDANRRGFCEASFTLRGISTTGTIAPELGGGDLLFESNVSRNVIIRHNALF